MILGLINLRLKGVAKMGPKPKGGHSGGHSEQAYMKKDYFRTSRSKVVQFSFLQHPV